MMHLIGTGYELTGVALQNRTYVRGGRGGDHSGFHGDLRE
jgi:hypothetical protein